MPYLIGPEGLSRTDRVFRANDLPPMVDKVAQIPMPIHGFLLNPREAA